MKKAWTMAIAATLFFTLGNITTAEMIIGMDAVHAAGTPESLGEGSWYALMRSELEADGYTIKILNNFDPGPLSECDIVFVSQARNLSETFSKADIMNLQAFVADGNSLIALAEGGYHTDDTVANFNELLAPYGIAVNSSTSSTLGHAVSDFQEHELTDDIENFGVDLQRSLISITNPATDLTNGSGEDDIVAVVEFPEAEGGGTVIVFSDSSAFSTSATCNMTINDEDNMKLLENISVMFVPEPSMMLMVLAGALSLGWIWRRSRQV